MRSILLMIMLSVAVGLLAAAYLPCGRCDAPDPLSVRDSRGALLRGGSSEGAANGLAKVVSGSPERSLEIGGAAPRGDGVDGCSNCATHLAELRACMVDLEEMQGVLGDLSPTQDLERRWLLSRAAVGERVGTYHGSFYWILGAVRENMANAIVVRQMRAMYGADMLYDSDQREAAMAAAAGSLRQLDVDLQSLGLAELDSWYQSHRAYEANIERIVSDNSDVIGGCTRPDQWARLRRPEAWQKERIAVAIRLADERRDSYYQELLSLIPARLHEALP